MWLRCLGSVRGCISIDETTAGGADAAALGRIGVLKETQLWDRGGGVRVEIRSQLGLLRRNNTRIKGASKP